MTIFWNCILKIKESIWNIEFGIKLSILLKKTCIFNYNLNPQTSPKYIFFFILTKYFHLTFHTNSKLKNISTSSSEVNASIFSDHSLYKFVQSQASIQRRDTVELWFTTRPDGISWNLFLGYQIKTCLEGRKWEAELQLSLKQHC